MTNNNGANLITHSRMRSMRACPRKHYYLYEIGVRVKKHAQPLRMGAAFHRGIELHETGQTQDQAIAEATTDYATFPDWCEGEQAQLDWLTEGEIVRRMLSGYFWRWQDSPIKTTATEFTFEMPLVNPETGHSTPLFAASGKIDSIVELPDKRLAVREIKLQGDDIAIGSELWRKLRMDQQISLYMLGARHAGHDVQAVLYDVARKPGIRPKKLSKADRQALVNTKKYFGEEVEVEPLNVRDRETVAMYGARLTADIAERPDFYFARMEIPRLESDLEEFQYDLWDQQKAIRDAQRRGQWPRNSDACLAMGTCAYFDICSQGIRLNGESELPAGFERVEYVHLELQKETTT